MTASRPSWSSAKIFRKPRSSPNRATCKRGFSRSRSRALPQCAMGRVGKFRRSFIPPFARGRRFSEARGTLMMPAASSRSSKARMRARFCKDSAFLRRRRTSFERANGIALAFREACRVGGRHPAGTRDTACLLARVFALALEIFRRGCRCGAPRSPPTVLGFYMLVAMDPQGPLGSAWSKLFGHGLAFTFQGLIIASVLYSLPFAVQPLVVSFEGVDRALLAASAVLGAGKWSTFRRVILPLSLRGVATSAVLSFAHTLGEFGVVLMVGGNLAGITRTVSIEIYDRVQSLGYAEANRLALLLLVLSFAVLSFVYGMNRRVRRRIWIPWASR